MRNGDPVDSFPSNLTETGPQRIFSSASTNLVQTLLKAPSPQIICCEGKDNK